MRDGALCCWGEGGEGGKEERERRLKEEEDANLCIYQNIFHRSCRSLLVHHHHEMLGEVINNLFPSLCASSQLVSGVSQDAEREEGREGLSNVVGEGKEDGHH